MAYFNNAVHGIATHVLTGTTAPGSSGIVGEAHDEAYVHGQTGEARTPLQRTPRTDGDAFTIGSNDSIPLGTDLDPHNGYNNAWPAQGVRVEREKELF